MYLVTLIMILLCLIPSASGIDLYHPGAMKNSKFSICGRGLNGYPISIPKQIYCSPPNISKIAELARFQVELWVPRAQPQVVAGAKCYFLHQQVCTYVGFFNTRRIVSVDTNHTVVSYSDCLTALNNFSYKGMPLVQRSNSLWSSNHTLTVHYKYCCYTHCTRVINFVMETGEVATMNGLHLSSNLADLGSCIPQNGQRCVVDNRRIIWKPHTLRGFCSYIPSHNFTAVIHGNHIIIDEIHGAFTLASMGSLEKPGHFLNVPLCLPKGTLMTTQGVALRILGNVSILHLTPSFSSVPFENQDPENIKFEYLKTRILEIETFNFRSVWLQLCTLAQRQLNLIWQLLRIDPTLGARALLNRTDISAHFAGEALMLFPCAQVSVDHIFWNYTVDDVCYEYLPVLWNNRTLFVLPGSVDLVQESPKIPCGHHLMGIHETKRFGYDGTVMWISPTGPVSVTQVPIQLIFKDVWQPFVFNSPALFHDHDIGYPTIVGLLSSYVFRLTRLETSFNHLVNFSSEFSSDPNVFIKTFEIIGQGVGSAINTSYHFVFHLLSDFGSGIGSLVSSIFKGPLQMILNCVIIAVVICALLYLFITVLLPEFRNRCAPHLSHFNVPSWFPFYSNNILQNEVNSNTEPESIELNVHTNSKQGCEVVHYENKEPETSFGCHVADAESIHYIGFTDITNPPTKLIIILNVSGVPSRCMIDTGSSLSLISWCQLSAIMDYNSGLGFNIHMRSVPSDISAVSVTGHELNILGVVSCSVTLPTTHVDLDLLVLKEVGSNFDVIIGLDFMSRYPIITLQPTKGQLTFGMDTVFTENVVTASVFPKKKLRIPPFTAKLIQCSIEQAIPQNSLVLFEPELSLLEKHGLFLTRSVANLDDYTLSVVISNPTEFPVSIGSSKELGICVPILESQLRDLTEFYSNMKHNQCFSITPQLKEDIPVDPIEVIKPHTLTHLTAEQQEQFSKVINEFSDTFAKHNNDYGRVSFLPHKIHLNDDVPYYKKPYPVPFNQRTLVEEHIQRMLKANLIRPSNSPFSSPSLLVKKKDGTTRFITDLRGVNAKTVPDVYQIPRISDLLALLGGNQYFTTLDCLSGFFQIEVQESDRFKTAFATHCGHFEYCVLPQGLMNSPRTYQRIMEIILRDYLEKFVYIYMDDVLLVAKDFESGLEQLRLVLLKFRQANLRLKPSKCSFFQTSTIYLGHRISRDGVAVDESKIERILNFPKISSVTLLRSFLGISGYYRRFIKGYAQIAAPLCDLLRKDVPFDWTPMCEEAFRTLQKALTSPPILAFPKFGPNTEFILQVDASYTGIGVILSQMQEVNGKNMECVIAYGSRTLTPSEKKMKCAVFLEAKSVLYGFKLFRQYLYSSFTWVISDHQSLAYIFSASTPSPTLLKYVIKLAEFDYKIIHRAGKKSTNVDGLSRMFPTDSTHTCSTVDTKSKISDDNFYNLDKLSEYQRKDPNYKFIIQYIESGELPDDPKLLSKVLVQADFFDLIDNVLVHLNSDSHSLHQIAVPKDFRLLVLNNHHTHTCAGHFSFKKCYQTIKQLYWWPGMYKDTFEFCKTCEDCQKRKPSNQVTIMPLGHMDTAPYPWHTVAVDIIGPINSAHPEADSFPFKYVILYTCYLTKFIIAYPLKNITALTVAESFVNGIVTKFGSPFTLLSDLGTQFTSEVFKECCKLFGTNKIGTSGWNPKFNGQAEISVKNITRILSMLAQDNPINWHKYLHLAVFAYNTSWNVTVQEVPFFLFYGRSANGVPNPAILLSNPFPVVDIHDYKTELQYFLHNIWNLAAKIMLQAQLSREYHYNKKVKFTDFKLGDLVLLHNTVTKTYGLSRKLFPFWFGPMRIVEIYPYTAKIVPMNQPKAKPQLVNLNRLKHFYLSDLKSGIDNIINQDSVTLEDNKNINKPLNNDLLPPKLNTAEQESEPRIRGGLERYNL